MRVEVDQSGKIADTKVPTVLAFSNKLSYAILIPATEKRVCLHEMRRHGHAGTTLYLQLFSTALYLLLKDHIHQMSEVFIDIEYAGHNTKIKEWLLNLLKVDPDKIHFTQIHRGRRKPPAHDKAYYTYRGELEADKMVTADELLHELVTKGK